MRIWSLHPRYLDPKGLVALWREGLLAQKVLQGLTKGYTQHPQLTRFKHTENPVGVLASYLTQVANEADKRGYTFDRSKIVTHRFEGQLPVTSGQLAYEFTHLSGKLKKRAPELYLTLDHVHKIQPHPIFYEMDGPVEAWEIR